MRLDGKSSAVESWPNTNIGYRAPAFAFVLQQCSGDIDAASGQEFLIRAQIQSGECKFTASAGSAYNRSCQDKRSPQQPPGLGDLSLCDFAPDHGAGDYFAVRHDWRDAGNLKTVHFSQVPEQLSIAGLLVAKAKILADEQRANLQFVHQNLLDEFLWTEFRQFQREWHHHCRFNADRAKPLEALFIRGETFGRGFRP